MHTDSGWNGFDGAIDGLEIGLRNGKVGRVDFSEGEVLRIVPADVPDEQHPRINTNDAPPNSGPSSWRGPSAGTGNKSNWHAFYQPDGSGTLSALLPDAADTLTLADLASISYATKRPAGTPDGDDWWVTIYTRKKDDGHDAGSWYRQRYHSNFTTHTVVDAWQRYSTAYYTGAVPRMTFDAAGDTIPVPVTLAQLGALVPTDQILAITVQTNSGWNGFEGSVDGLEVTLDDGSIGRVNFGDGTRLRVLPDEVPDEQPPRASTEAPAGYGPGSWQGPASGKTNWHAWYEANGSGTLSALFPTEAATLKVGDLTSLAYWTKRPADADGRDWWITIYTRPDVGASGWYHARYISNFDSHSATSEWVRYATNHASGDVPAMTFRAQDGSGNPTGPALTLAQLAAADPRAILSITVQTASNWGGFDGLVDGLEIAHKNGRVAKVDFGAGERIGLRPSVVPDEQWPRANAKDAPANYGAGNGSWLGPAAGKSNVYISYNPDSDVGPLKDLFDAQAATLTVSDLASISYFTKRPTGLVGASQDWWVTIYTRANAESANDRSWYKKRYISNFGDHSAFDAWTQYSTVVRQWRGPGYDLPAAAPRQQPDGSGAVTLGVGREPCRFGRADTLDHPSDRQRLEWLRWLARRPRADTHERPRRSCRLPALRRVVVQLDPARRPAAGQRPVRKWHVGLA